MYIDSFVYIGGPSTHPPGSSPPRQGNAFIPSHTAIINIFALTVRTWGATHRRRTPYSGELYGVITCLDAATGQRYGTLVTRRRFTRAGGGYVFVFVCLRVIVLMGIEKKESN